MKEFFIVSKKLERNDTKRAQRKTGSQRFSLRGKKFYHRTKANHPQCDSTQPSEIECLYNESIG